LTKSRRSILKKPSDVLRIKMPNHDDMPIKELRKLIKEKRAGTIKAAGSMKRHELLMELAGRRSRSPSPVRSSAPAPMEKKEVKKEVKKEEAPVKKPAAKKAPVANAEPDAPKPLPKATAKAAVSATEPVKRLVKGSQEAQDKMAALRARRNAKNNVE
jgi:hypothetical protein